MACSRNIKKAKKAREWLRGELVELRLLRRYSGPVSAAGFMPHSSLDLSLKQVGTWSFQAGNDKIRYEVEWFLQLLMENGGCFKGIVR